MYLLDRARLATPVILGAISLATVAALLVWDAFPALFSPRAHDFLGAMPLALIALSYLAYQVIRRPEPLELLKAIMLALAFLFWAANQLWPEIPQATLFNDIAIALFVIDVFFVVIGCPATDENFAQTGRIRAARTPERQ